MRVLIRDKPSEILLNTVSISFNYHNPDNVYLFRCYRCGSAITQIRGNVFSIDAGLIPNPDVTIINSCHTCHQNYTFQSGRRKNRDEISLSICSSSKIETFHCLICRMQLFQYTKDTIIVLPEMKEVSVPVRIQCFNPTCTKKYLLEEIVTSQA